MSPLVKASADLAAGCGIQPYTFTDNSFVNDPAPTTMAGWDWDFGDFSAHSSDPNPTHTYDAEGTYTVRLTVTDSNGLTDTHTMTLKVVDKVCPPPKTLSEDNGHGPVAPHDGTDAAIADADMDGDGIANSLDNCVSVANGDQSNVDGDLLGDACDADLDGDGIANADDNCPAVANLQQTDLDGDGLGDACDPDADGDTVADHPTAGLADNCLGLANTDQVDLNGDGIGDACQSRATLPASAGPAAAAPAIGGNAIAVPAANPTSMGPLLVAGLLALVAIGAVLMVAARRRA